MSTSLDGILYLPSSEPARQFYYYDPRQPLVLCPFSLMTDLLEILEGSWVIIRLYLGNDKFVDGLHELALRHQTTLQAYCDSVLRLYSDLAERSFQDALHEGIDPRPVLAHFYLAIGPSIAEIPGIAAYADSLRAYRHEWHLAGRDAQAEVDWQYNVHLKLLLLAGIQAPLLADDREVTLVLWGKPSILTETSHFAVAVQGAQKAAQGTTSQLRSGFHRARPRRTESLRWLYWRLAERRMPIEIANSMGETQGTVKRLVKRDADLLGLKLPAGWPKGRRRGRTRRMVR